MSAGTTPMLEQYWRVKSQHPDKLVFFRLGDFYELFYEDAQIASRVLELTLTARENKHERIPMCGVPYHAAETYLSRLIERGYKVVICDQVEDARRSKGLVRREVVRVVTPGTLTEGSLLEDRRSNYLVALYGDAQHWALAAVDLLTGECQVTATPARDALPTLIGELHRLRPAECLLADGELQGATGATRAGLRDEIERIGTLTLQPQADFAAEPARRRLEAQFGPALAGKIVGETPPPVAAALGALLAYLTATQQQAIRHLKPPRFYQIQDYLVIDATARQHLELTRRLAEGKPTRAGTLLAVLDHTLTAMGGRRLEAWLEQPLVRRAEIEARLDAVEQLWRERAARDQLRQRLSAIYDLERLAGRIALGSANARELLALRRSLEQVPAIKTLLQDAFSAELLIDIERRIDPLTDVREQLASLVDDPPPTITEGGLFRDGHHAEIDSLRQAARHGRQWLADLERDERERTGIKSLKVGFNKVFGYYLEVTRPNRHLVPSHYERKQTLANAERFVTPELKAMEERILGAEERLMTLEYELFVALREQIAGQVQRLQQTGVALAELDALAALAEAAARHGYVRPRLRDDRRLRILGGRHPVVERQPGIRFVPNDIDLDGKGRRMAIVTGPNMGGKSTYLRQIALIVIMAQSGSFVPAAEAEIGIVDRIFTRIGAADELSRGRSTFRVEIDEALQVLLFGTPRSLAVIDELGRGTSTFDGIAFSTAYLEYLNRHVGCRALVSTHFFELTRLADRLPGVLNLHAAAALEGERLVFSYRIQPGAADRSYGIEVAREAGMPTELILRARELLLSLERESSSASKAPSEDGPSQQVPVPASTAAGAQSAVFALIRDLAGTDVMQLTPLAAMERLHTLATQAKELLAWYHEVGPQPAATATLPKRGEGGNRHVDHDPWSNDRLGRRVEATE